MKTNRKMFIGMSTVLILAAAGMLFFSFGVIDGFPEAIRVSQVNSSQTNPKVLPIIENGETTGAMVFWVDYFSGIKSIYARRVDRNGTPEGHGRCIFSGLGNSVNYQVARCDTCDTGNEYMIVTQKPKRTDGNKYDIYAQKIDVNLSKLWGGIGKGVCIENGNQTNPQIIPFLGGAIMVWEDDRNNGIRGRGIDIYAQMVRPNGNRAWTTTGGIPICTANENQIKPQIALYNNEELRIFSAMIVWEDYRNGQSLPNVHMQTIQDNQLIGYDGGLRTEMTPNTFREIPGSYYGRVYPENGYRLTNEYGIDPKITTIKLDEGDFSRVMIVYKTTISSGRETTNVLKGYMHSINREHRVRRQLTHGFLGNTIHTFKLAADNNLGAILAWDEKFDSFSDGSYDIYAQRMDENCFCPWRRILPGTPGVRTPADTCLAVTTDPGDQKNPNLVYTDDGVTFVYEKNINNSNIRLYVKKYYDEGFDNYYTVGSGAGAVYANNEAFTQTNADIIGIGSGESIVVWEEQIQRQGFTPKVCIRTIIWD